MMPSHLRLEYLLLTAFGIDSMIELVSEAILLWCLLLARLTGDMA